MPTDFEFPFPLLIIAGKGGVGKTVLTAALGTETAKAGHSTLLVELGGQNQLRTLLGKADIVAKPDDEGIISLGDNLSWLGISPDRLLAGWLSGRQMGLVADRLERSGALEVIATSVPGIKDVLTVGFLRRLVDSGRFDRIIVDGPASGRARELLRAPMMVARATSEGPIYDQATRGHELLTDTAASALLLVTLAEETPVNETIETAFDAEDEPGIHLAGVVVNRVFPATAPPKGFDKHPFGLSTRERHESNMEQIKRLEDELPVPRWITPENPHGVSTQRHIDELLMGEFTIKKGDPKATAKLPPSDLGHLDTALNAPIVVTVGTGGVGKTTLSATLAYSEASKGRSVALITIDPAKRLADALGIDSLDDSLTDVSVDGAGRLQVTMLDPGKTFERVVREEAEDEAHAERVLASPLAKQLTDSLSGMTEYMAVERLWQLHNDPEIDLVIVDTPPSSDALAFLDAPTLLARLLDNRIYKLLVHGKKKSILNRAIGGVVGQLVATVGGAVVRDAVELFQSFEGIEDGFRTRGDQMYETLRSSDTEFVVVASATGASLSNAREFVEQLEEAEVSPSVMIANRFTPEIKPDSSSKAASLLIEHLTVRRASEIANLIEHAKLTKLPTIRVHDLPTPVTSLEGVQELAKQLHV